MGLSNAKTGLAADLPSATRFDEMLYIATDTGQVWVSDGTQWIELTAAGGGGGSTLLGISKRTSNYTFVSAGAVLLPADVGDLGFDALAVPADAELKLTLGIPQFQLGADVLEGDDIFFEIGNPSFTEVYAAIEWSAPAAGPKYMPVMLTSVLTDPPATIDLRVRLTVPNGRTILEAGGYADPAWQAPAFLLAEALVTA